MAGKNGQFYGVGLNKAGRRKNRPDGSPRKVYAYTRKEQRGTPLEDFINSNYADLDEQRNAAYPYPGRMEQSESSGGLAGTWQNVNRKGMGPKSVRDYRKAHPGMSMGQVRTKLVGMHQVSFGADPKSR